MRTLIAILYFMALGWCISHYELDRLALEAGHKALRGLMREHAEITLEVHGALAWAAQPPLPAAYCPCANLAGDCDGYHPLPGGER